MLLYRAASYLDIEKLPIIFRFQFIEENSRS